MIQKVPEQQTGNARNKKKKTIEIGYIGHCKFTSGSTEVKLQNIQRGN